MVCYTNGHVNQRIIKPDYKEHFKSESKTNKKEKKENLSSDEEEMEYIPEETVTRSGRKSRKTN